jgi:hypothetical protein
VSIERSLFFAVRGSVLALIFAPSCFPCNSALFVAAILGAFASKPRPHFRRAATFSADRRVLRVTFVRFTAPMRGGEFLDFMGGHAAYDQQGWRGKLCFTG